MTATDVQSKLSEFVCVDCGERCVAQDQAAVDQLRATHHCPTAEQIRRALRGEYDG